MVNAAQDKVSSTSGSSAGSTDRKTVATISRKTLAKMDLLHDEAKRFCGRDIDVGSAMTLRGKKVLTEGVPRKTRKLTVKVPRAPARAAADATATADDTPASQLHPASAQPQTPPAPLDSQQRAASPVPPGASDLEADQPPAVGQRVVPAADGNDYDDVYSSDDDDGDEF